MFIRPVRLPEFKPAREPSWRNNIFTESGNQQCNHNDQQLARAYVPVQTWTTTYSPQEGLSKGTIFPDLYRPYICRD
ncbi:MAG: spore coat associated protein CotJA [Bacillota bacterium]|uniref:spore coat associated protein CotJA n=1 Tax=Desulfurispora thermophila TaxID=265470 RepID=UPI0003A128EA|nr:spore coat associated protein CotJA [Desulfurispora thermophila]